MESPLSLVIIEDEEAHFALMKRAIDKAFSSASIHHFEGAGACLERLGDINPDIIITDYLVSGMNGIEFLEALRRGNKDIPVVMITGQGSEGIAVQAMKLGACDYLVKSGDFFALLPSVIEKVIREQKLKESFERSKRRFEQIFAESPIGIGLYDSDGLLLDLNKSCLEMFGIADAAEVRGFDLFADPNVAAEYKASVAEGETVRYEVEFDFERIKKLKLDETTKSGTLHLDVLITPLASEHAPQGGGYLVQLQDITARKRAQERIHSMTGQLIKAQENERRKISRDLHDNLGQKLSTIRINLDTLFDDQPDVPVEKRQRVSELSRMMRSTISDVRNLAYDLRPAGLDNLGLVETVHRHCEGFSKSSTLRVDLFSVGLDHMDLGFNTEIALFRIIQEGLNNILQHADASHVTVRLSASFPSIILCIEDDGKGFDVEQRLDVALQEKCMGIQSMKERVALLRGKMKIESYPTQGTKILVEVPCKEE